MNKLRKRNDNQIVSELPIDTIIEILHLLPSKSLVRFKCVCRSWALYVSDCRSKRLLWSRTIGFFYQAFRTHAQINFLFTSLGNDNNFAQCVNFLPGCRLYIIASTMGFLLCCEQEIYQRHYYVYNPATRQNFAVPQVPTRTKNVETGIKVQICPQYVAIGFYCSFDDPTKNDIVSFMIVRYQIPAESTVTIESFSSKTNAWTETIIVLEFPLYFQSFVYQYSSKYPKSGVAIDGVFYWLDLVRPQINVYDSVNMCFWSLDSPDGLTFP
ncbi:hypothetical protein P3S67_001670 [Capsicum chacoense]